MVCFVKNLLKRTRPGIGAQSLLRHEDDAPTAFRRDATWKIAALSPSARDAKNASKLAGDMPLETTPRN